MRPRIKSELKPFDGKLVRLLGGKREEQRLA
jgi:hypothetical protein